MVDYAPDRQGMEVWITVIPDPRGDPHAVATFEIHPPVTADRIRIVNLLDDLFEIEVES